MVGGVPLGDVLRLPSLARARLVAGASGVDRVVRRVNVMEVPDILGWVGEAELLLTTAYPLREDPEALAALVPALAERGLAGLAIKPARYIPRIPDDVRAHADELGFPLIELAPEASFNDIITSVLTVILNEQAARLQRIADAHERFTSIVLVGGGLRQIAEALAGAIDRPVAIADSSGAILTATAGAEALQEIGADLRKAAPAGSVNAFIQPIRVGGEQFGALAVALDGMPLDEEQADAVEYAATITALRQVQARAVGEADRRFQAVCLEELITGHVDRAVLTERAVAFDWDLASPRAVVLARTRDVGPPNGFGAAPGDAVGARRRLAEVLRTALGRTAIVWERTSEVGALVTTDRGTASLREVAERVVGECARGLGGVAVGVGVGRIRADPLELPASFAEARRALDAVTRLRAGGGALLFEDLGVDRLLATVPADEARDFAQALLGRLIEHDARNRGALVETLDAYLETRNAALAARRLFIHYNTMKNRLAAIEELIGPFRDEPDRCLGLALALRIMRTPTG